VTGTLRCYQAAVPLMATRRWGRIINISSMAAGFGGSPYGLTKNTVERMTAGMAHEVGDMGITVNCVAPGISAFEAAIEQLPNADAIVANNAIKRMGTTRDLYGAMAYLCSSEAEWVTGQTIRVDGGGATR
jgi:NAD(P)-dependent dehydrogenase (short-subunit alcohol dehydrogenase family)